MLLSKIDTFEIFVLNPAVKISHEQGLRDQFFFVASQDYKNGIPYKIFLSKNGSMCNLVCTFHSKGAIKINELLWQKKIYLFSKLNIFLEIL